MGALSTQYSYLVIYLGEHWHVMLSPFQDAPGSLWIKSNEKRSGVRTEAESLSIADELVELLCVYGASIARLYKPYRIDCVETALFSNGCDCVSVTPWYGDTQGHGERMIGNKNFWGQYINLRKSLINTFITSIKTTAEVVRRELQEYTERAGP